jgi:thiamine-monophosphate kinase
MPSLSPVQGPGVVVGPGDDAAVLKPTPGHWVATTDCLVEETHFRLSWLKRFSKSLSAQFWRSLGWKVLAINLSDLAAMGSVRPFWALVTAGLPGSLGREQVDRIHQGLVRAARRFRVSIVGGDTVRSSRLFLSVAVVGELRGPPLLRSQARPGHRLGVTGTLGDARAGLECIQGRPHSPLSGSGRLAQRFFFPTPRLREGWILGSVKGVGALMDVSDGLWRSLEILSKSSKVGYRVDIERLPLSSTLKRWAAGAGANPFFWAAAGGEDYELLFTYPPRFYPLLRKRFAFREIGEVLPLSNGNNLLWRGKPARDLPVFEHF